MLNKYLDYLADWIKESVKSAGADGVIIGISGGIDSAVVACLAKKAFPNNHLGVYLPCESSQLDLDCYNQLKQEININSITVDINNTFKQLENDIVDVELSKLARANTKARIRMTTLYAIGQTKNYLVLGTDNAAEWHLGYFTKFGDGGVDLLPLVHLLKREVKQAAKLLSVPEIIINRPPTASLFEGQTDEAELGFSYNDIDDYLSDIKIADEVVAKIERLHKISEHKRVGAPKPKTMKEIS